MWSDDEMPNDISLCMIVKNEEENLPRCLDSIKDLVDEIIIVDTGSEDRTVEISKSYGAKVYHFKWCDDFSAARNESLKYASKEWILIMDADDEFSKDDKDVFRKLIENLDKDIFYSFETFCYFGEVKGSNLTVNLNPRLFKNNYGFKYEGAIHNQLVNFENNVRSKNEPIRIYHYGYLNSDMEKKDKHKRNITILEQQVEKNPEDKFNYFNLGNEYFSIGEIEKSLEIYYKAFENFDPYTGFASKLIERIIITNYTLKKYDEGFEFIEIGIGYYPEFTDLYYLKGLILVEQERYILAIKAFEKCIELGDPPPMLKSIYGTGGFRASHELVKIYMKLKDYDKAYFYCIKTIGFKSDYLVPLYNVAHIFKEKKLPIEEFKQNLEAFFTDFPREYTIVADLFYLEGYYETALEYIEKYEMEKELPEDLKLFKIKCLIRTLKFEECVELCNSIPENSLYYFQAVMHKIMCFVIKGKYETAELEISQFNESKLMDYNKRVVQVYKQFLNLIMNKQTEVLSEDEKQTEYTSTMFKILEILLRVKEFEKFEKTLNLLNLISDKTVLLQLGKLYYKCGYIDMAKYEIMRSIDLFDVMDEEGLDILKI